MPKHTDVIHDWGALVVRTWHIVVQPNELVHPLLRTDKVVKEDSLVYLFFPNFV